MHRRRLALCFTLASLTSLVAAGACGRLDTSPFKPSSSATTSGSGGEGGSGGTGAGTGGDLFGDDEVIGIELSPTDALVVVKDGVIPAAIPFTATGKTQGGEDKPVSGSWSYDRFDVGSIDAATGAFTATGLVGGTGTVTFKSGELVATTTATVKLSYTSDPVGVPDAVKVAFDVASEADPALSVVYPYDQTVFPRGLAGPTIQWNGGGAGDVYRVRVTAETFELVAWASAAPPSRFDFPKAPDDTWRKLTDSTAGAVTVEVQRHDGAKAYLPKSMTWTIAPANLAGTIYYWEVNNGNVVRLKPGDTAPENFLQKPPGVTCVACHSVSKDGSRIVASFHGGYSPWGTFAAADGASLFASNDSSGFQAISPDGAYVLWRHWSDGGFNSTGYLSLSPYNTTAELAKLSPGSGAPAHPAWSGDGQKVAFSVRTDGNGLDFTQSTLWVTDVDLVNYGFSGTQMIVANDAARPTVTFPTWSPDSKWIAFERATQARSRGAQSSIWLTSPDGLTQVPLDAANGAGALSGEQLAASYEPTFNPVSVGGYFWLVIVSERVYGNTLTDTNPGTRHKQLWVSAVDANPSAGADPSHPAFWLPGQELNNQNMRGEWALSPCKQIGESCQAGFDCCDGFCHEDESGAPVCSDQPGGCSSIGEACTTAADCCDPEAVCTGGFCAEKPPT
jgi:hypothetical protein